MRSRFRSAVGGEMSGTVRSYYLPSDLGRQPTKMSEVSHADFSRFPLRGGSKSRCTRLAAECDFCKTRLCNDRSRDFAVQSSHPST